VAVRHNSLHPTNTYIISLSGLYFPFIIFIMRVIIIRGNSLCAIKKDRNALCAPVKVQRSSAPLLQLFYVLHATSVSLDSNAVKLQV